MTNSTITQEKFFIIEWIDRGAGLIDHSLISVNEKNENDFSLNDGHFHGFILNELGAMKKEEALNKIKEIQEEKCKMKYVAVFENTSSGQGFWTLEGDYSGNWKGSREHPYSLSTFWEFSNEEDKQKIIKKAEEWLR